jgi:Protein of unknown function (DUF2911)
MKKYFWTIVLVMGLAASAFAQQAKKGITPEGGEADDRGSARVLYWDLDQDHSAGQFAVNYGRPVWKKDYEDPAKFDAMTKGKVWRMGSNFWSELDTCLPLHISGKSVGAGLYYLGMRRSEDGAKWTLVFIDPAKIRQMKMDGFEINKAPIWFETPVAFEKTSTIAEKLTITMVYTKENMRHVTMKVQWGNMELTAPIEVTVSQ